MRAVLWRHNRARFSRKFFFEKFGSICVSMQSLKVLRLLCRFLELFSRDLSFTKMAQKRPLKNFDFFSKRAKKGPFLGKIEKKNFSPFAQHDFRKSQRISCKTIVPCKFYLEKIGGVGKFNNIGYRVKACLFYVAVPSTFIQWTTD